MTSLKHSGILSTYPVKIFCKNEDALKTKAEGIHPGRPTLKKMLKEDF